MTPVLELTNASFGYTDHPVLAGVDLRVDPGEAVAILGPNGSGKSTLVKGVLGLAKHFDGEVRRFGVTSSAQRARIGYVPQRHTLSTSVAATASEIVSTGRLVRRPWWRPGTSADRLAVQQALELVRLSEQSHTEVSTLSGGQQRRVLIARALAAQPEVLLMDEPTAGVDATNQHVLADVLIGIRAQRKLTLAIVTHELGPLVGLIDRVVVVDQGQLTWDGSIEDFIDRHDEIVHDHDSHHHDIELHPDGSGMPTDWRGPL